MSPKILSDYFHFNQRERKALLLFLVLISVVLGWRLYLNFNNNKAVQIKLTAIHTLPDTSKILSSDQTPNLPDKLSLQLIDPNTASFKELMAVGLSKKQAAILIKYRQKGMVFKTKQDLLKVYSIDSVTYSLISAKLTLKDNQTTPTAIDENLAPKSHILKKIALNDADTIMLQQVNGIGAYLARRIVWYREKLGGFVDVNQLLEIKGMHPENYEKIKAQLEVDEHGVSKININQTTLEQLKKHPYVDWQTATILINYREQHGHFKNTEDLFAIFGIEKDKIVRLIPYLSVE